MIGGLIIYTAVGAKVSFNMIKIQHDQDCLTRWLASLINFTNFTIFYLTYVPLKNSLSVSRLGTESLWLEFFYVIRAASHFSFKCTQMSSLGSPLMTMAESLNKPLAKYNSQLCLRVAVVKLIGQLLPLAGPIWYCYELRMRRKFRLLPKNDSSTPCQYCSYVLLKRDA